VTGSLARQPDASRPASRRPAGLRAGVNNPMRGHTRFAARVLDDVHLARPKPNADPASSGSSEPSWWSRPHPDALAVLAGAPRPRARGRRHSSCQIAAALRRGGRQRRGACGERRRARGRDPDPERRDHGAPSVALIMCDRRLLSSGLHDWDELVREAHGAEIFSRRLGERFADGHEARSRRYADPVHPREWARRRTTP
jgi:hypothetical protein